MQGTRMIALPAIILVIRMIILMLWYKPAVRAQLPQFFLTAVSMAGCEGALGSPTQVALSAARKSEPKNYRLAFHFQY